MPNAKIDLQPTDSCINKLDMLRCIVDWCHMSVHRNKWVGKTFTTVKWAHLL